MPVETPHDEGPPAGFRAESRSVYGDFYVIMFLGKAGREAKEAVTPHARPGINLPPADRM